MACPIKSSEQYKELVDVLGSTEMAHLVWDRNNGYALDFNPDGYKSTLFDELLDFTDNDRREAIRMKAQVYMDWYTKDNGLWYQEFKEEPKLANTPNESGVKLAVLGSVLDRLSSKFGYKWVYNTSLGEEVGGRVNLEDYDEPTIEINPIYANLGSAIHEFGHIFIAAVQRDNPTLYNNLVNEINNTSEGQIALAGVKALYPKDKYSDESIMVEAIVKLLDHYGNKMLDEKTGLFKLINELWSYIKDMVCDALGVARTTPINPKTTIMELAYIVANPDIKVDLGKRFTNEELVDLYNLGYIEQRRKPAAPKDLVEYTPEQIVDKFKGLSELIVEETDETLAKEKGHWKYKKDDSYEYLQGVTSRMAKFGYGFPGGIDPIYSDVGKTIHGQIEDISNDVIADVTKKYKGVVNDIKMTQKARKELATIFKQLKGKYTALTEVRIADFETGLVGVVDLILISETGRVMVFDFKTKIRKTTIDSDGTLKLGNSNFLYWNKANDRGHTDRDKAHLQLSIYAHMIEKSLNIPVSAISVVKLDAVMKGTVTEVKGRKQFKPGHTIESIEVYSESEDIIEEVFYNKRGDLLMHNAAQRVYYGDYSILHSQSLENEAKQRKDRDEIVFSKLTEGTDTEAGKLVEDLRAELASRLAFARKRYDAGGRKKLENLVEQLMEEESVTESLYNIILNAAEEIDSIIAEVNKYIQDDIPFTPGILYRWKDAVQGFKSLNSIQQVLFNNPELIPNKKYVKALNESILRIGYLENLYKTEGRYLIAKWLTPFYNGIKVAYVDSLKSDYRRLKHKEVKKGNKSLEQFELEYGDMDTFVNRGMKNKARSVDKETFDLLYKELEIASRDIGEMTRWIDNMLDQSDPVSSALVNAFVQADEKARLEAIDTKYEIADMLEDLMETHQRGLNQSEESYYSFLLEHDDEGKPTQYFLRPYKSTFWSDVENIRQEYKTTMSKAETAAAVKEFQKSFRSFNQEEFDFAIREFVEELYNGKKISTEELYKIAEFLNENSYINIDDLEKVEGLEQKTIDAIIYWKGKNISLFYEYDEKYVNKEWSKFMNLLGIDTNLSMYNQVKQLKESKNPYAVFYTKIEEISKQANQMLPSGYRIYDRLPGVAKLNSERLKAGQSPLTIMKETMGANLLVRPEDIERGNQEYTNEYGRVKYYIPINYTAKIEPENQSYDIPGIFFKFWESANDYRNKRNILPELEMTRFFINQRKAYKRNVFSNVVSKTGNAGDDEAVIKDKTVLAEMFNDWFDMALYGKMSKDDKTLIKLSDKKSFDVMKFVDVINRYTSMNLLAMNFVQGTANMIIGEVMQATENIAHEYVSPSSYSKATLKYNQFLPGVLGDVGRNVPSSLGGMIYEEFNVLNEDITETAFSANTAAGKALRSTSMYFMQRAGEHWLQNRFLLAMLTEKKAYTKEGVLLGSMLDQYEIVDGKLKLKDEVDLTKSEWTEKDKMAFKMKVKGVLSRMHGEYSDLGRVALQRVALGRMAYMFRKFVVPGFRRRWASRAYRERLGQYTEGNYITTAKFIKNYYKELATFQLSVLSENWAALSDHEKANIRRTISEAAFLTAAIILASAFYNLGAGDDDEWLYGFLSYQAYRLKAELLFFSPKIDEAWSILRSPMASMAVMQNIIDLSGQIFQPGEVYERGPWKGQLKIKKVLLDFVPVYKQFYKARDIEQQVSWFR